MPRRTLTEGHAGTRARPWPARTRSSSQSGRADGAPSTTATRRSPRTCDSCTTLMQITCRRARFNRARIVLPLRAPCRVPRCIVASCRVWAARSSAARFSPAKPCPARAGVRVSRTALREAIKVLMSKGLVEARPRFGTRVRSREAWQLLDPDVLAWQREGPLRASFLRNLAEVRSVIEPAAAAMAALRATAADITAISLAYDDMATAVTGSTVNIGRFVAADRRFHAAILRTSGNDLLEQMAQRRVLGAHRRLLRHDVAARVRASGLATPSTDSRCDSTRTERRSPPRDAHPRQIQRARVAAPRHTNASLLRFF